MIEEASVLSDLDCPVCFLTTRSAPIYQCGNGHLVCSECRPYIVNCPVCNIDYIQDLLIRNIFAEKTLEKIGTKIEEASVLSDLECPVCLLTPRSSPIYQCGNGHLVCSECWPLLVNCPVCNIHYFKDLILRNSFAEKMLQKVERCCRYELNDCKFKSRSSAALIEHETNCGFKPVIIVQNREPIFRERERYIKLLVENFVTTLSFLRFYIVMISHVNYYWSFTGIFGFLFHIGGAFSHLRPGHDNCFDIIMLYIVMVLFALQIAKMYFGLALAGFLWYFKPAVTMLTGVFCSLTHIHLYGYRGRMGNLFLFSVILLSFLLARADVTLDILSVKFVSDWKYIFGVRIAIMLFTFPIDRRL